MNVLIVGANRGLGLVLTELFAEKKHQVFAGVTKGECEGNLARLENVQLLQMDITNEKELKNVQQFFQQKDLLLDVIINVAGILRKEDEEQNIIEISLETIEQSLQVNAIGSILLAKYGLQALKEGGKFYVITSEAGSVQNNGSKYPAYSLSKATANKIVYILEETFKERFEFLAIHPGRMNTEMGRKNAQIEPIESALGIYKLASNTVIPEALFVNYKGEEMQR